MNIRLLLALSLFLPMSTILPAGKELEGERAAAKSTCPSPEEAARKMSVPPGYAVRCFAHEPMVVNPVAMTWDSRGRLWVVEGYEYPNGSPFKNEAFGGEAKDDQYHPVPSACTGKSEISNLKSQIPRDRIVILEDSDNDGVADKRTIYVEGLDMGSAILMGDGGVYVGQQPHLLHFKDTNGDDHADEWRVVLTGFGREDTHELLNSFCWGPDGWLYMTHGVFTNSRVRRPGEPKEKGFKFDAGLGRCRPRKGDISVASEAQKVAGKSAALPWEFEVFADGTSNPWGCDYDARGNFFVSACVIDHFFHMAPGGLYQRQGGAPENPYAYELLPSIVKHKHFRAAYAGVQIYQGGAYPEDTHGHAFIGNIHDNAVHEEVLTPVGATFKCEPRRDFLRANDGWFRPVSTQTGPDGNLWIMDWCDKYPCYQNAKANPEGVDRERGRIWRVAYTGGDKPKAAGVSASNDHQSPKGGEETRERLGVRRSGGALDRSSASDTQRDSAGPKSASQSGAGAPHSKTQSAFADRSRESRGMDLSKLTTPELVKLLGHSNNWMRRMASRQIIENWNGEWSLTTKPQPHELLLPLIKMSDSDDSTLAAVWTLIACDNITPDVLQALANSKSVGLRTWAARIAGEFPEGILTFTRHNPVTQDRGGKKVFADAKALLDELATDKSPAVRLAVCIALRQGRVAFLTTDKIHISLNSDGTKIGPTDLDKKLLMTSANAEDKTLPFAIWMAVEPGVVQSPNDWLTWLAGVAATSQPLSQTLTYKSMRRLCDTRNAKNLDLAVAFCGKIQSHDILLAHALDGLVKGQEAGVLKPTVDVSKPLAAWRASKNSDVRHHAQELAVLWGDAAATEELLAVIASGKAGAKDRLQALQTLRKVKSDAVRKGFVALLSRNGDAPVVPQPTTGVSSFLVEAIRAAGDIGGDEFIAPLAKIAASRDYGVRLAALEALAGRPAWAHRMLDAIAVNKISAAEFPASVRRQLATNADKAVRDHAFKVLGAWKESSDDIKALIAAKRKACLEGEPDLAQGKIAFTTTCAVCHSFHGGGQKVGPDLIGSGRSNLDALLANVIDPNQIIGNGYENINVTTKDGRTVAGRMVEDTPSHVKLLAIAGAEQVVPRDQVASLVNTHQSVMPVGFGALPDDVFRNLVWYILAPPEEGPLTKEKKKLLSQGVEGAETLKKKTAGSNSRAIDWEGVSLWNPAWKVDAPDFERTPMKLPEFHGRRNVLLMHPFTKERPCSLERKVKVGKDRMNRLSFFVAAHDQGDFELRVKVDGEMVKRETISHDGERWKRIEVDLAKYAGREVTIRLEGAANGWSYEFGYWSDLRLD